MKCRHPEIKVQLTGHNGNAFLVLRRMRKALEKGGVFEEELQEFIDEATSGDYDHLLATCMAWADVG